MVEMAAGKVSSRSEAAPRKELLPRLVRATGKLSSVSEEHSARASLPIVVRVAGSVSAYGSVIIERALWQDNQVWKAEVRACHQSFAEWADAWLQAQLHHREQRRTQLALRRCQARSASGSESCETKRVKLPGHERE